MEEECSLYTITRWKLYCVVYVSGKTVRVEIKTVWVLVSQATPFVACETMWVHGANIFWKNPVYKILVVRPTFFQLDLNTGTGLPLSCSWHQQGPFFHLLRHNSVVKSVLHSLHHWSIATTVFVGEVALHYRNDLFLPPMAGIPFSVQPSLFSSLLG